MSHTPTSICTVINDSPECKIFLFYAQKDKYRVFRSFLSGLLDFTEDDLTTATGLTIEISMKSITPLIRTLCQKDNLGQMSGCPEIK